MLYLFVGLKIPILMLGAIVWWAVRQTPEPIEPESGDGGRRVRPHAPPEAARARRAAARTASPPRCRRRASRKVTARARQLDR